MTDTHVHYAWPMSLYSGKTRAYLRYKSIPHVEKPVRIWTFPAIRRHTGATVMPVVVTPQGEWLQDSSHIMDVLESRYATAPVIPATPRQQIAAYLLEAWGDEFWLPSAMHYRWNFPENFTGLFRREGGDHLLPFAPRFVKNHLIDRSASFLRSFLPILGVVPAQHAAIEAWTVRMLDVLDTHFARHHFLLGTRPCYGDFGLIGPLFAHLGRDPYPRRTLIEPRPALKAWIARMQDPPQPCGGEFLPNDEVPETLAPLFGSIFSEFWPYLEQTQVEVAKALPALGSGHRLRRALGEIEFPLGAHRYRRLASPFSLWMAQRPLDAYRQLQPEARAGVDAWLRGLGGERAMQLAITPRLKRDGLHVLPE